MKLTVLGMTFCGLAGWLFAELPRNAQIGLGGIAFSMLLGGAVTLWVDHLE
jgi:hypothetical protein